MPRHNPNLPAHGPEIVHRNGECPMLPCRDAHNERQRNRRRMIAYGRWEPLVDAKPVRRHVRKLLARPDWSMDKLAAASGVSRGVLNALLYPRGVMPVSARIRVENAQALMNVQPDLDAYVEWALVDGVGTQRRLLALHAVGWPLRRLDELVGLTRSSVQRIVGGGVEQVRASTARTVRDVYNAYWDKNPAAHGVTPVIVRRTRNQAALRGCYGPLCWDDMSIDDPRAKPRRGGGAESAGVDGAAVNRALRGDKVPLSAFERTAAVEMGVRQGMSYVTVSEVLGIDYETVKRTFERCKERARARGEKWPDQHAWTAAARRPATNRRSAA
jgi:DNA-binding Xre family transcriptional regulator